MRGPWSAAGSSDAARADRSSPDTLPSRNWGWFLARGVLLIAVGLLAMIAPGPALVSFAMLFAAFSFADGVMALVSGVRGARAGHERLGPLVLSGIAGIVVGVVFMLFPLLSTFAYALTTVILIAVWAVATGGLEIAAAVRLRKQIKGEWLLALSGTLSVLLGLAIAFMAAVAPGISMLSVAWLIGIYALVAGIALVVLAFRLRRQAR
jgi:uncharacterized membrane protein HdeD (DUF308 family)